ncbi:hypothetical protein AAH994_02920 [Weeksellaceae bacterium A-14]
MKEYICRICGYDNSPEEFWEDNNPTYTICPCCGGESGNEDYTIESAKDYRTEWIENDAKWFDKKHKPENWDLFNQLEKIPQEYK